MPTNDKRILIVDDDEAIRALLFTILRRRRFAVDGARNGVERWRVCGGASIPVMLLDLMMPLKSGYDVLDELKKLPADARPIVFVLTAGNEPRDLDPAMVAGSIRKPFDVELLMATVTACMNALDERPQLPDCPPPDSAVVSTDKVN